MIRHVLFILLEVMSWLIFARIIISWIPNFNNKVVEILYIVTEPILEPIRKLLNKTIGDTGIMVDLSPIVAFLLIGLIQRFI